jgi:hypothetical protein
MSTITGVVRNGQVILDEPAGLPEGTRVAVVPVEAAPTDSGGRPVSGAVNPATGVPPSHGGSLGMREEDWPTTPEGIAALLRRWHAHEPLEMTPEEEAAWRADLRARNEQEKVTFDQWSEEMRRVWE